ncbi:Fic family protein [Nodosilinea sp. E11]|uniref:Fic family protein n=1 Tax=Nodosilinea sp. E11 TaxID=3037479 RepID=UPI0029347990|nr:Fic family protein [Nodosilinea sp. E11]WOD39217.1 Fic family protein [Nodosilinea sp. E11]
MSYQPPFEITSTIVNQVSAIAGLVERLDGSPLTTSPQLRKQNRIRTIQGTLAIEGNSLTLDQVTAILNGQRVLGHPREISEVQGAIRAYEALPTWAPTSRQDLLQAHRLLMADILTNPGKLRPGGVGIYKGTQVSHVAPPAKLVPQLIGDLLDWLAATDHHPLITSSVFHYELEFIHPFVDGNGRMGRLWQTLILGQWHNLFYLLPIESLIKDQQDRYYQALEEADRAAASTGFIEFMLDIIRTALSQPSAPIDTLDSFLGDQVGDQVSDQVRQLLTLMDDRYWSTRELMAGLSLSHKPTFRKNYLNPALQAGFVVMKYPDRPRSPKQKYKRRGH